MYYGHTVAPEIETFMDNAAKDLTGNEAANDKDSYNMGYYNGAMDMARYLSKEIFGCEVIIERDPEMNGMHVVKPD